MADNQHGHGHGHGHGQGHTDRHNRHADQMGYNRTFVRSLESERYTLTDIRRQRLAVDRVIRLNPNWDDPDPDAEMRILDPGDQPFRSQSLHVHFETLEPLEHAHGHGHQNEALFYWLAGRGHDIHDGERFDWEAGDVSIVDRDRSHWHNNDDPEKRAMAIIIKAKPTWLFMGLWQQGVIGTKPADDENWEPRIPWSVARTPQDEALPKVLKKDATPFVLTPHGNIRELAGPNVPLRIKLTDAYIQDIPGGSRSGKRWQMRDQLFLVLEGEGYDLHHEVDVDIDESYYARVAKKPTRWEYKKGDVIWVPQNMVFQHFNTGSGSLKLLGMSNRLYRHMGYTEVDLENAPEWDAAQAGQREPAAVR
jgi:mannose-6-phosphate isomerase-like protein (cupin superfamily)